MKSTDKGGIAEAGKPDAVRPSLLARGFASAADRAAHLIGQPHAFILLSAGIAAWAAAVYLLHIADGWRPVDGTIGVVTFLMVFLVQSTQNRHSAAIQAKLDELIRALATAENKFMGIEKLTIEEVHELRGENEILAEKIEIRAAPKRRRRARTAS